MTVTKRRHSARSGQIDTNDAETELAPVGIDCEIMNRPVKAGNVCS